MIFISVLVLLLVNPLDVSNISLHDSRNSIGRCEIKRGIVSLRKFKYLSKIYNICDVFFYKKKLETGETPYVVKLRNK